MNTERPCICGCSFDGHVAIHFTDKKPKQYRRADGDYIEFEEIDDKK